MTLSDTIFTQLYVYLSVSSTHLASSSLYLLNIPGSVVARSKFYEDTSGDVFNEMCRFPCYAACFCRVDRAPLAVIILV